MPCPRSPRNAPCRRLLVVLCLCLPAAGGAAPGSADPATAAARPLWHRLLHLDRHGRSRIDSPGALLAAGAPDLATAELQAALEALDDPRRTAEYQCRFPARTAFLRQALPGRAAAWPSAACPEYTAWRARLPIERVTLVFASAYLNNPSSMFGHTLLRLDAAGRGALLSFAVNYAARATDAEGLAYAWKGLTGGYEGRYGLYPYYDKVQQYARIENRDLWEYPLELGDAEIDRLLAHLWELREARFDYYFLDENCSFQLLALLEVARPDLELTRGFRLWAAPVETIRALRAQPGLVGEVVYRPALQTRLAARIAGLDAALQQMLLAVLDGSREALPEALPAADRARLAELVHDWAWYQQQNSDWISGGRGEAAWARLGALAERALTWRARLPGITPFAPGAVPVAPDRGHGEQRVEAGGLWNGEDGYAARLGWRPGLHDGLDAPAGYVDGATIEVLRLQLSAGQGRMRLHAASLARIVSQSPRDAWFSPWSWQIDAGFARRRWDGPGHGHLLGGLGGSWRLGGSLHAHAQGLGQLLLGPDAGRGASLGLELGLSGVAGDAWRWEFAARRQALVAFAGEHDSEAVLDAALNRLRLGTQWRLGRDLGLRLDAQRYFRPTLSKLSLSLHWHF